MAKAKSIVLKRKVDFQVLGQRVLINPIPTKVSEVLESGIILPQTVVANMEKNQSKVLMMGEIVNIGEEVTKVAEGDVVYVYPNQFEADIVIDGMTYLIYPERVLMGKVKNHND